MVELNLGTNQLTKIPEDISSLASLEVVMLIIVNNYQFINLLLVNPFNQSIVTIITVTSLLKVLILSNNHLRKIPAGIGQLSRWAA